MHTRAHIFIMWRNHNIKLSYTLFEYKNFIKYFTSDNHLVHNL